MRTYWHIAIGLIATAALVGAGTASAAKTAEPWEYTQCGIVQPFTPDDPKGSLTRDTVSIHHDFGVFHQGGITFHRVYHPETMRGTVSGTISGGGVGIWRYRGDFHGVITPDGMKGQFQLARTPDEPSAAEGAWKIVGTWESDGHPVAPAPPNISPVYCVSFKAVIIGPFPEPTA